MLFFYSRKEYIPPTIRYIQVNDSYFDAHSNIPDTDIARRILRKIEHAERVSSNTFCGRSSHFGPLDKQFLSTGTKTLLNIMQHPNCCFELAECGTNALMLLPWIQNGYVYSKRLLIMFVSNDNESCNIWYNDRIFSNFSEFLRYYEELYDQTHPDDI